ncbi:equilibrative nucleoside transporter 3 isoform X2 [Lepeophtheirus salmonis]|uniref:equilibrative nucleoside transporter 3 isoform X2 n=1 Tax=Lepeophtheirus salmonis TaxID=72036 RepID=UPI001AE60594|nr:uncharacterized protein LOC121121818 isoform X2 [Lepeophtheirus salmonis]
MDRHHDSPPLEYDVHEYWMYKFRDIPEQQHLYTSLQNDSNHLKKGELNDTQVHWGSYLSISSMVPYIIGLLFTIICGRKVPIIPRLLTSISVIFILLISTVIFAKVNTDSLQGLFLGVTLATIVIMNSAMSLFQGGTGGVAAAFPSNYMNALTQGQAIGGIISCSVNIGILAAGADHNTAAFMCFVLATLFTFICGVLIILMTKTDFYKYFHPEENVQEDPSLEEKMIERKEVDDNSFNEIKYILRKLWVWILAIFINFLVTLAVFLR